MDLKYMQLASLVTMLKTGAMSTGWVIGKLDKMQSKGEITEEEKLYLLKQHNIKLTDDKYLLFKEVPTDLEGESITIEEEIKLIKDEKDLLEDNVDALIVDNLNLTIENMDLKSQAAQRDEIINQLLIDSLGGI